jgi:hypothetical protein
VSPVSRAGKELGSILMMMEYFKCSGLSKRSTHMKKGHPELDNNK